MNPTINTTKKTKRKVKRRKLPKKLVSIRIDQTIHQQADQLAKADKRSFSQYVEMVLEQHIKEQQTLTKYFKPGVVYPVFTPYGEEAAAEKLTELLKRRSV
jgi:predicted DNA-binding protein